jgi:predicted SAM-dependent methyltransferase
MTKWKSWLKRSDTVVAFAALVRELRRIRKARRYIAKRNKITQLYLASNRVRKLEIGADIAQLDGWLSTDIDPESDRTVYLDATKRFPFESDTFDYVYCEHMIEHISWQKGLQMLQECRRVLKPGGTIRVATPDLEVLLALYSHNQDPKQARYIKWITDKSLPEIAVYRASFVINNAFRNWGHQFLYDGELMELAMRQSGFTDIKRCPVGESDDKNLRGIESHGKNICDDEIATFESMVFEGRRPDRGSSPEALLDVRR